MESIAKLLIFLLGLFPLSLNAQEQPTLWFHGLNEADGLSVAKAANIFQDSEGFTWIASEKGLNRFDGRSTIQYQSNPNDSTALQEDHITGKFFEDNHKDIWFCTNMAIHCYHRKSDNFSHYYLRDQRGLIIQDSYYAIYLERDSFLWVRSTDNELFRFNIHHLNQLDLTLGRTALDIEIFPGVEDNGVLKYLFSVNGSRNPTGLETFEFDQSGHKLNYRMSFDGNTPGIPALKIHTVFYEQDTSVWLSSNSGIAKWNLRTDEIKLFPSGRLNTKKIAVLDPESFIVSEREIGLFLFNKKEGSYSRFKTKLLGNQNFNLNAFLKMPYLDPLGNLWLSLDGEGVIYTDPDKLKVSSIAKISMYNGSKNYQFRNILQDRNKNIWISTYADGIFFMDKSGKIISHYHPNNPIQPSLIHKQPYHMMIDRDYNIWVGTPIGVAVKTPQSKKFRQIYDVEGKSVKDCVYFYQIKTGEILVSSLQNGIYKVSGENEAKKLQQILPPQSDNDFFTTIYQDNLASIYICHKMAEILVFNYSNDKLKKLIQLPIPGFVNGFHEDKNGKSLWIAASSGLVKIDKTNLEGSFKTYDEKDGLRSKQLQSMVADQDDNLWISATNEIIKFDMSSENFTHFTLADGIQSTIFYELAAFKHTDGSLWFGGNNGITVVRPEEIGSLEVVPIIQLTEIKINDEPSTNLLDELTGATNVNLIKHLKRNYRENTLSFEFVAIDYSDPKATQLEYYMEGEDKNWVTLGKGEPGFARYSNLSPGDYAFKVRAYNSDGIPGVETTILEITIRPPWYQTWWAYSLYVLIIFAVTYAVYSFRIAQFRKKEAFKRKEAEFRQKEAEYKQLMAETETAVLRLQMNPHFIFNSMNSISSYILQKDIDTANDYLGRFAKLMRMILKFAAKPFISVATEIDLLEQYLQTEAMRFEKKFAYSFDLGEGLEPDEVLIPTMILQPFVENAIWHGFSQKKEEGHIHIRFRQENNSLFCSVEDNGIGRAAAEQMKGKSRPKDSKALSITAHRLKLLEDRKGATATFEIIDLFDKANKPRGTKVLLRLPLL